MSVLVNVTPKQKKLRQSILKRIAKIEKRVIPKLQEQLIDAEENSKMLTSVQLEVNLEKALQEVDFLSGKLDEFDKLLISNFKRKIYSNIVEVTNDGRS